ncbi:EF-hand calcium-binding domain-containing protein 3 isoform X2 [Engystomops pustulosus]|uniref:EF-hand calcium-binding domain-containing protein 3 isoform X2 n=1 Tax=Engystomops pustulosus TaxID=76066 RepID=UPI003AFAF80B
MYPRRKGEDILKAPRIASAMATRGAQDTTSLSEDTSSKPLKHFLGLCVRKTRKEEAEKNDSLKRKPNKIMQFLSHKIEKRDRVTKKVEKDSPIHPSHEENISKALAEEKLKKGQELLHASIYETTESPFIEQEPPIEKHFTAENTEVDTRQDIHFYINESESETKDNILFENIKVQTEGRKTSVLMYQEQQVEITLKDIQDNSSNQFVRTSSDKGIEADILVSFTGDREHMSQEVTNDDLEAHNEVQLDNGTQLENDPGKPTETQTAKEDKRQDIHIYINGSESETEDDILLENIKVQSEGRKTSPLMIQEQKEETILKDIPDISRDQYLRTNPDKGIKADMVSFTEDREHMSQEISDNDRKDHNEVQPKSGTQIENDPSKPIETQKTQDLEILEDHVLHQDSEAGSELILNSRPELIFDEDTRIELVHIPEEEPERESIEPENRESHPNITAHITKIETHIKKTPNRDLEKGESLWLQHKEIYIKNNKLDLKNVKDKDIKEPKTQDLKTAPSGMTAEKGTQVNDIILRNHRIPSLASAISTQDTVCLLGEREAKPRAKSSYKNHSQLRLLRRMHHEKTCNTKESTRRWKWWEVSQNKNNVVTDHKVSGEQTSVAKSPSRKSPEMLKEILPNVNLTSDLVEAFQDAFELFRKDKTKRVNMNDLQYTLSTMGIHLSHQDAFEALKSADIDGDGKVNFSDFLLVLTDDQRFFITVDKRRRMLPVSDQEYLDTVLFDAISRLLKKCHLSRKSAEQISKYYQEKFEAIPQLPKLQRSKSSVMVDFARGTRIMGMTDRQLVLYLEEIKANKGSCIGSPYDVIPCVPLCTKADRKLSGQTHTPRRGHFYKRHGDSSDWDLQRDVRGMTHRGIQVDIFIPGCKHKLNPITTDLSLSSNKLQRRSMNDQVFVGHKVDEQCTEVIHDFSKDLPENPNEEQEAEIEDLAHE